MKNILVYLYPIQRQKKPARLCARPAAHVAVAFAVRVTAGAYYLTATVWLRVGLNAHLEDKFYPSSQGFIFRFRSLFFLVSFSYVDLFIFKTSISFLCSFHLLIFVLINFVLCTWFFLRTIYMVYL